MVITKLNGGLGNQMFQYAAGRRLAHVLGTDLKLDTLIFHSYKLRPYALGVFNIYQKFASPDEVKKLTFRQQGIGKKLLSKMFRRPPKPAPSYIGEKHFHFDPEILTLSDSVYLDGYWQSEKYFIDIEDIIRKEFTIIIPQDAINQNTSEFIMGSESVSIHVRRGDYVSNEVTRHYHGTCPIEYYHSAIDMITEKIEEPHFCVFSDEPDWANKYLKPEYPVTYIDFNGKERAYEDLRLMIQCKHHIIANSTFSWWGAWLCQNPNKIVYAPAKWFNDDSINTKDLLPDGWIRI
jgi:hypothetical protein